MRVTLRLLVEELTEKVPFLRRTGSEALPALVSDGWFSSMPEVRLEFSPTEKEFQATMLASVPPTTQCGRGNLKTPGCCKGLDN